MPSIYFFTPDYCCCCCSHCNHCYRIFIYLLSCRHLSTGPYSLYVCVVEYLSFFPSFRIDSRITLLLLLLLLLLYSTITHTWCRFVLFHATLRLECCSLVEKNALLSSALVQSNPILRLIQWPPPWPSLHPCLRSLHHRPPRRPPPARLRSD